MDATPLSRLAVKERPGRWALELKKKVVCLGQLEALRLLEMSFIMFAMPNL